MAHAIAQALADSRRTGAPMKASAVGGGPRHEQARPRGGSPRKGDVVVAPNGATAPRFTVRQVPGDPQVSWGSRAAAVDCARQFARRHAVDAWLDEGASLSCLVRHRSSDVAARYNDFNDWRTT
jgi:hypothetical protein